VKTFTKAHISRATRRMFDAVRKGDYAAYKAAIEDGADIDKTWFGIPIEELALTFHVPEWGGRKGSWVEKVSTGILIDLLKAKRIDRKGIQAVLGNFLLDAEAFDLLETEGFDCSEIAIDQLIDCGNVDLWEHCKERISIDCSRVNVALGAQEKSGWYTPLHISLLGPVYTWRDRYKNWRLESRDKHPERIDALIEAGCGIEDRAHGDTPLFLAIKKKEIGAVEALLRCGARTDARDCWDFTLQEVLDQVASPEIQSLVDRYLLSRQTAPAAASVARGRL